MKENKPTLLFVGAMMLIALVAIFAQVIPWERMVWWLIAAAWETWTILNNRKADTISESIWELSKRPLVPWLFGAATVWGYYNIPDLHALELAVWLGLSGHFFWQAHQEQA